MFTEKIQSIIDLAKDRAFSLARERVDVECILAAVGADAEGGVRLAECLTKGNVADLRGRCPEIGMAAPCPGKMEPDAALRSVLEASLDLASGEGVPDRRQPGFIGLGHLVCALAMSRDATDILGEGISPISRNEAMGLLVAWQTEAGDRLSLGDLVTRLRGLRQELLSKVFGQDHAAHAFVEGLYNAQVTAVADKERKRPEAVFVFAGPPGVGKTYMSELCAAHLGRPFRRFDMTSYTDHQAHSQLIGWEPSYKAAQPGALTGFVEKNPNAILLFDEIEKAHLNTVQLFYQILDSGRLEDKYLGKDIAFRGTIIIFTTNAGRSLYDNPNRTGIGAANSLYHKRTILSALENEKNPSDGRPAFPPAICSRLGMGYPVMFNHLSVNELERITGVEMARTETLLERQYFKTFTHNGQIPITLVFREGARTDARQLRAEAEKFVKAEMFKFCSLFTRDRLEEALNNIDEVRFALDTDSLSSDAQVRELFEPSAKPKILLATSGRFAERCRREAAEFDWIHATSPEEALERLAITEVDFILLDLWLRKQAAETPRQEDGDRDAVMDYVPLAARELDQGREMLRRIHERFPQMPVYLLSFRDGASASPKESHDREEMDRAGEKDARQDSGEGIFATVALDAQNDAAAASNDFGGEESRKPIDDELFLACVRAGGARGLLTTDFGISGNGDARGQSRRQFVQAITALQKRLYREKKAQTLAQERKVLSFDTVSAIDRGTRMLTIRLTHFRLTRALDAADAGELVSDVERPTTRFDDVLGATEAKKAMQFIVDWLRNPKRYAALGLRPPKGILMAGPPGTGKTMLARALAGESNCAFLEKSATSFVTIWQGSGPQNIRDLFARARRYAPAIVFIDEIDAIGKERTGGPSSRAEEETLNALLTEMDGFGADRGVPQAPVIVLAATNLVEKLDEALKRRFDRTIEVDKPDRDARLAYLKKVMAARQGAQVSQQTLERLAGQTAGMTIANLERIVQEAGVMAAQAGTPITDALFEEAFEKTRMGVAKGTPDPETLKRVARHEAGHTLIAWLGGNKPVQVTIVGRGGAGGFMERESDEDRMLYTKPQLEQLIREVMAGRAAEILYYGEEEGLSTGVSGDLRNASIRAARMVQEFGMCGEVGQIAIGGITGGHPGDGPLSEQVALHVRKIVDEQLAKAIELLKANRAKLDALVDELLRKNRLTREEMEGILGQSGGGGGT